MKKIFALPAACLVMAIGGCASTGQLRKVEATGEENQRVLRETDQRLHNLENNVAALNSQVALLNNRVYEVRTRGGHKTGMTVVPIIFLTTGNITRRSIWKLVAPSISAASIKLSSVLNN